MAQTPKDSDSDSVRAVDRALDILKAFRPGDDGLTPAELLQRVQLSRPTLYRLLHTLVHNGFLEARGEPQRFRFGPAVAQLAHVWSAGLDLASLAQPMLHRLREATGETAALFIRQGEMRVCIAELPSLQPLSFRRGVGYQERLVLGASGRAILAHVEIDPKALARQAKGLGLDLAGYPAELRNIRSRGYAVSHNELIDGAVAVAAPFFDGMDQVRGALAVFGPGVRLKKDRIEEVAAQVVQEAGELSRILGRVGRAA